jgi:hypothetical protein
LLLFRVAPDCEAYVGVDFADSALAKVAAQLSRTPLPQVTLRRGAADDLADLGAAGSFDTIVINSVVQYFPDVDYLVRVLSRAMGLLAPGGAIFVGDVRSLPHLPMFHAAIELAKVPASLTKEELRGRVQKRASQEGELVLDPALFSALRREIPDLDGIEVRLKDGRHHNELTRFRYDVVLRKKGAASGSAVGGVPDLRMTTIDAGGSDSFSLDAVHAALREEPSVLRVLSLPNARLSNEAKLVELLGGDDDVGTAGELRAVTESPRGFDPDQLKAIDPRYSVDLTWSRANVGYFDAILRHKERPSSTKDDLPAETKPWSSYANQPVERSAAPLGPEVRAHVRATLPDFMVPSAFVVLDALPRTPNGKIDRKALPAPDRTRTEGSSTYAAPGSEVEQVIASVWQDMLALDAVGVDDRLFDLGANSLMMVQANGRLRAALGRDVSLVDMFRFPTVRSLAEHLGGGAKAADLAVKQSLERGQTRQEAMRRRREARQGSRSPQKG